MVHACVVDTHIWYHITMCCILLTVDDILSEELRHCYGLLSPSIRTIPLKDGPSPSTTRVGLLSLSTSVLSLSCDNKERGREHVQSLKTYCARQHKGVGKNKRLHNLLILFCQLNNYIEPNKSKLNLELGLSLQNKK